MWNTHWNSFKIIWVFCFTRKHGLSQLGWLLGALYNYLLTILCIKNDTGVAHYNFNAHQMILVIFGRDVAERVCYQKVIRYPTSPV